jgi:sodium/proline symporter
MSATGITFVLYLLVLLGVGIYTVRITRNLKDFALGGHRLGPWVIAFSERASGESAWLIIGLPGAALVAGLLELWTVVGCVTGIILSWLVVARPIRLATETYGALTLPELLSKRLQDESGVIRWLSSLIITFFFTFYVAAQFSGAGKVLHVTFGLTPMQGMILGALIIVVYTILGGFFAVAWTDLIQGIIMIGTLVILPVLAWMKLAGLPDTGTVWDWGTLYGGKTGFQALIGAVGGLSWGLGYLGQPHLIVRYMAINKTNNIRVSRRVAIAWAVPAFFGSLLIGLVGYQLLQHGVLRMEGQLLTSVQQLGDPEKLMPVMANTLLPQWLAGVFISGAIAAMMSTADSQLLVSTTVLTEDVFKNLARRHFPRLDLLTLGRIFTVMIGVVAFYLAWQTRELVFEMVSYAWSGLGASFGPALILTLWWRRTTKKGVIAGMLTGALTTVVWANLESLQILVTERLVSFVLAFLVIIIVSLWDRESAIG